MQFDDGKIRPKFAAISGLFLVSLITLSALTRPTQADSTSVVVAPAEKVTSIVTSTLEQKPAPVGTTKAPISEEPQEPVISSEVMQEKSAKIGLTCKPVELSTKLYYNPEDVSQPSQMTLEQLESFTQKYCPEWVGLEEYILEQDNKVNLIFLLSVARMETWAGSECVGDFNCFNIRYDSGNYVDYNNYTESIDDFVRLITEEYLDPDGLWHEGSSIEDIGKHYAQPKWAGGITDLGYEIYEYML